MFQFILSSYWFGGRYWLNIPDIRARVAQMGMNVPLMIFGFGTFQTLINSFIEEYTWRGFVDRHCRIIWTNKLSLVISAIFFTLHHIILLTAYCDDWRLVLVGSIAVFSAGVLWARCIRVYNSLLPSYLSHMAADLALQIISWHILLG
jgi:membrane protease YdiL (CAAX protease family)